MSNSLHLMNLKMNSIKLTYKFLENYNFYLKNIKCKKLVLIIRSVDLGNLVYDLSIVVNNKVQCIEKLCYNKIASGCFDHTIKIWNIVN